WNSAQRENAATIVQVGVALAVPERGQVVALAAAIQESRLYNLGDLGAMNDHDTLGLFKQRPSMGWGTAAQVTDPVFAATAFYLALNRVRGWESMAVTVAAQRVQRSAFPNAYAQWETDARSLVREVLCNAL
ncbi:MAG: M23 family peptidase, partial [Micromonosporaceae bacterium]